MKAAVLRQLKQPLVIEDVHVPEIGPDDVLVETHSCGICRTDLHIQDGLAYVPSLPHIPGHEPAGVVTAIGSRVRNVQVGQRVVPHLFVTCGQCSLLPQRARCTVHARRGRAGRHAAGAFAEYFAVPARNLLTLPDEVGFDAGGLVSCAVVTAVHAYRRARIGVNDTVVVLGAGGIGLILTQLLKAAGARVVVVSRAEQSLRMAAEYDADLMLLANAPESAEEIREFSAGEGASCVFECVGTGDHDAGRGLVCRPWRTNHRHRRRAGVSADRHDSKSPSASWKSSARATARGRTPPMRSRWSPPARFARRSSDTCPWKKSTTPSISCAAARPTAESW